MTGDNGARAESDAERRLPARARRVVDGAPLSSGTQRTTIAALFAPAVRERMREAREREGRS
ncbi:hypothetical protein [Pseudonocardia sp. DLS-67]